MEQSQRTTNASIISWDPYNEDPYNQGSLSLDSQEVSQDTINADPVGWEPYNQDPYNQGALSSDCQREILRDTPKYDHYMVDARGGEARAVEYYNKPHAHGTLGQ